MKIFKSTFLVLATFLAFLSCQKELKFDDNGVSVGTFKKDAAGDCLPVTVNGVFKVDSVLTTALFVDVQINATTPGTFDIRSDTVNGYSFARQGSVVFGTNTIRLFSTGKPIAAGTNTFTVKYGTSTCTFDITVVGSATGTAVFTLGSGVGGACTGATAGGVYTVGTTLTPANTLTVQVNVTTLGTYSIGAASTSGFLFSGTGLFSTLGLQNVTLTGSGTPTTAGNAAVAVVTPALSSCTFNITVLPVVTVPAVYTFDGGSGICTNFVLAGTYTINTAVTAANTVTLNVTVTTPGTYTITTNTVNGMFFTKTGTFTTAGNNTVVLNASGTPTAAGNATFYANGTSNCNFTVNVLAVVPPPNTDYFPLTNNSWWSYNFSGLTGVGDTAYNVIYGTKTYNANTYSEMQDNFQATPFDTAHYRKSGNDYWEWAPTGYYSYFIGFESSVYVDINFLKENSTLNTTWTTTPAYSGLVDDGTGTGNLVPATLKYTFKITEINASITVNSVTYTNVIHVTVAPTFTVPSLGITDGVTENDDYYYAKGIGLIKMVFTPTALIGGGAADSYGLKNYKVF